MRTRFPGSTTAPGIRRRNSANLKLFLVLSCAIAGASAAEPVRVTDLMTKALVNVPGKEPDNLIT
jgi:hypothetical protein